jgi:hypothetical protein
MIEQLRALFGSANKAAEAAGVSRQRLSYWAASRFELTGSGAVYNSRGVRVGAVPVSEAALQLAAERLRWVGDDYPTSPAQVLGPLAQYLPAAVGGRLTSDAAPAGVWLNWINGGSK